MKLYKENGEEAGLFDVCRWWIYSYPPDIFIRNPKSIIEARMCMQNILAMHINSKRREDLK